MAVSIDSQGVPPRFGYTLFWLWGSWMVLSIVKALQHQSWQLQDATEISLTLVVVHSIVVIYLFLASGSLQLALLIIGAYFARLFTMLIDRFATLELPFLGSGGDADGFFRAASTIADDLSLAGDTYGGTYTAILGYFFHFVGTDRLLGQYLNVLLGITTVILLAAILRELRVNLRITGGILALAAFMPLIVIHSSILLRETIIQVLVTAALFSFVKGLLESRLTWTVVSILFVLVASVFHSGVVGVLIGFAVASTFTYSQDGHLKFGLKRVAPAMLMVLTAFIILLQYPELFLGKFQTLESPNDLLDHGLSGRGGSGYLTGMEVDSWLTFGLFAPIRAFYFIAAPLPWEWRGANDLLGFGLDAIVYLSIAMLFFVRARKIDDPNRRYLALMFVLILTVTCLIFGVGVSNAGTAIRHRGKLIALFLVLLAIVLDSTRKNFTNARPRMTIRHNDS